MGLHQMEVEAGHWLDLPHLEYLQRREVLLRGYNRQESMVDSRFLLTIMM